MATAAEVLAAAPAATPMPCFDDDEWERYMGGVDWDRSVHYSNASLRRAWGVTDVMVSACLDCPLEHQRAMLVAGRCRPPAHDRPITPIERAEAERA